MHVPEIIEVKELLSEFKSKNLINSWELPYENLLTRRSAAIFFVEPMQDGEKNLELVWAELRKYENFSKRINQEKKLSVMTYRITFSKEEKEKNEGSETLQGSK